MRPAVARESSARKGNEGRLDLRVVVKRGGKRPRGEARWGRAVVVCRVGHVYTMSGNRALGSRDRADWRAIWCLVLTVETGGTGFSVMKQRRRRRRRAIAMAMRLLHEVRKRSSYPTTLAGARPRNVRTVQIPWIPLVYMRTITYIHRGSPRATCAAVHRHRAAAL